ncbi:MAG: ribosome maturation factor RimP [Candidatus Methylomirabilales bacterium]
MAPVDPVIERIRALALPVVEGQGMELVDVVFRREARGWMLRLYLDKPGGVTVEDCREVSEQLSDLLDVEELIEHPYTLEVSSPGLDRVLRTPGDFLRFAGRRARIQTTAPIGGQRRFHGRVEGYREGMVILRQEQGPTLLIPLEAIAKARLEVEL